MNLINMQKDSIVFERFSIFVNGYGCEVYVEKNGNRKIDIKLPMVIKKKYIQVAYIKESSKFR